jgi:hypothetical protein
MSDSEEPEPDMEQANKKKVRGESLTSSVDASEAHDRLPTPLPQAETQEVKEVTQGVKDVELEARSAPESVPLPDEESDDLDESSSSATPPPEIESQRDAPVDEGALGDPASHQDEPEAVDQTAVTEKAPAVKEGKGALIVEGQVPVPVVTANAAKSEPARKLRSKAKDASTAKD